MVWSSVVAVTTALVVVGTVIATCLTMRARAEKYVETKLEERLDHISGGRLATLEDLVAETLREKQIREETPIAVYGKAAASLRAELAKGRFASARLPENLSGEADVAVVQVEDDGRDEGLVRDRSERYVLVYKKGEPYRGAPPPGAMVTFANSRITLEARLMEMLRHREVRRRA